MTAVSQGAVADDGNNNCIEFKTSAANALIDEGRFTATIDTTPVYLCIDESSTILRSLACFIGNDLLIYKTHTEPPVNL